MLANHERRATDSATEAFRLRLRDESPISIISITRLEWFNGKDIEVDTQCWNECIIPNNGRIASHPLHQHL
jgi:hypothetical protein